MTEIEIAGRKAWVDHKGRIYMVCSKCQSLVRINKPFLGSVHLCLPRS